MQRKHFKRFRFPIIAKTIVMIVVFGLVLAEVAMVFFSITSSSNNQRRYKEDATDLSNTVALSVNKKEVEELKDFIITDIYDTYSEKPVREKEGTALYQEYMAKVSKVKQTSAYINLQKYLNEIKKVNSDVDGIYLGYVDYANKLTVYLVYDQENEVYPVGIIDHLYEEDYPMLDDHEIGFVASIYESELDGGFLCTAGMPVHDDQGEIICYALVDISLVAVRSKQANSIIQLFLYLVASVLLLSLIGITVVTFTLIRPVRKLTNVAKTYDANNPEQTHANFYNLKINTHDEFSDLADSMRIMESDVHNKIRELVSINAELIASQNLAKEMTELANKDALTGVRNKGKYTQAIEEINVQLKEGKKVEFGIVMVDLNYLKMINDQYGHDKGDAALVKLCNMICAIFAHSPVFRVGGDEFVVLLRNRDYRNIEKLVNEFNNKIEELENDNDLEMYEKTSAAIGYHLYNPKEDTCAEDVFKKADHNMYVRKWLMKQDRDKKAK